MALCALLGALAGCRVDVTPEAISVSADAGDEVAETLTITNPGDEPVDFILRTTNTEISLSHTTGTLEPGAETEVTVSMNCSGTQGVTGAIRVSSSVGNKSVTIEVPVALRCYAEGDARLVSLELFQGPPIYKKDFETGVEVGPVSMTRPENGATPLDPVGWNTQEEGVFEGRLRASWSADNQGVVTAVWRRQAAVAVAVRHADDFPMPEISAEIEGPDGGRTALPRVYQDTERDGGGFLTDTVFYIDRALYDRGAVLYVSLDSNDGQTTERLALFGEEVMPFQVTWVPVILEDLPEEVDIVPEEWVRDALLPFFPIGDYETGKGPTLVYEQSESDKSADTPPLDSYDAMDQLIDHRALHACGPQEVYFGVYNRYAMLQADLPYQGTSIASLYLFSALGGGPDDPTQDAYPAGSRDNLDVLAHEQGHLFTLGHAPCGPVGYSDPEYPYEDGALGPTRSWDFLDARFAGRPGDRGVEVPAKHYRPPGTPYSDLMGYCGPGLISDYNYQRTLLLRQSPVLWEGMAGEYTELQSECASSPGAKTPTGGLVAKSAPAETAPRSIAITGAVDADGIASVRLIEPTTKPAWPGPASGDLTLIVLDSGGSELHRQPLLTSPLTHADGRSAWSARVPYFEDAATVVLRGPEGDERASALLSAERR